MFTGIIEDVGTIRNIRFAGNISILAIETSMDLADTRIGDSISVDGVCLTAVEVGSGSFSVEASPETLSRCTLDNANRGRRVNLERALRVGDRLGGHFVAGHVDGVGKVATVERSPDSLIIGVTAPVGVRRYIVDKGSVAVDGVSLTINSLSDDVFTVNIIRHTAQETILDGRKPGDRVNLEADLIGKYVERFLLQNRESPSGGVTLEKLAEEGYV
ncbi:MAG: riboflavin synthase [Deltaproteobacteria bacterium]|nr:riboflavin synthase [Candidatus Zymogenaceae bacterium]